MYVSLIEEFYDKQSLESSNAYYLMGIYYYEQGSSLAHKAIACFGRSLYIREKHYKPHSAVSMADCLLNLGLIYKQRGFYEKAKESLERALKIC
jgi:tetratricopeptide (TPR) repeat protein